MRKTLFTISCFAALVLASCGDAKKTAENADVKKDSAEAKAETPEAPMDSAAMMKAWIDYATPGDMHAWLASYDGKWDGEVTSWMSPDAPPTKNKQTAESKMVLGGRYQQSTYKGLWDGQEFVGESTMGYDNATKTFQSTWIDNMGTGVMLMEGKMDEATKTITLEGTGIDPTTGKGIKMREVLNFPDANTQLMEMYCEKNGKEEKTMEIKLTRK